MSEKSDLKLATMSHINAHVNLITLFSVHVNTTFRFINRNKFSPIEPQIGHVNVATIRVIVFLLFFVVKNHLSVVF